MPSMDEKGSVISDVIKLAKKKHDKDSALLIEAFIRRYFTNISNEDLCSRSVDVLYHSVIFHWNLFFSRREKSILKPTV